MKKVDAKADIIVLMVQVRVSKGIVWAQRDTWLRLRGQKCFPEMISKLSSEEQVEIGQIKGPRKVMSCQASNHSLIFINSVCRKCFV